ncbi:MAG: leucine-rich repeat domain-containing protein, partial [Promethearchaeota archaeon]
THVLARFELQDFFKPLKWQLPASIQKKRINVPGNLSLDILPPAINPKSKNPQEWIQEWQKKWSSILTTEESQQWLQNRLDYFFRGARGLFNSGLSDVLLAVPPLDSIIDPYWQCLQKERRSALFAKSGTGKTRVLLYLAAIWKRTYYQGEILVCSQPSDLHDEHWNKLHSLLSMRLQNTNIDPLLLIIDDTHHQAEEIHARVHELIDQCASYNIWLLGGYTSSSTSSETEENQYKEIWFPSSYRETLPSFDQEWKTWKVYFKVWIEWITDILNWEKKQLNWETINTPWEISLVFGDMVSQIIDYRENNPIKSTIYWLLAALFLLYNEKPIPRKELLYVLKSGSREQKQILEVVLGKEHEWPNSLGHLSSVWELPTGEGLRMLPPRPQTSLAYSEVSIDFYHQQLAAKLWQIIHPDLNTCIKFLEHAYKDLEQGFKLLEGKEKQITWKDRFLRFTIENNAISAINLSVMGLKLLPTWVLNIPSLKTLILTRNQLKMLSAPSISLDSLQTLNLSFNRFRVLPEPIIQLKSLKILDLSWNQLITLPESIRTLHNLQSLDLSWNQLTTLPQSLGSLYNLQSLKLYHNKLTDIPESIETLHQLHSLDLGDNSLTSLPESIGKLNNLLTLDLEENWITTLPISIGQLSNLKSLKLSNNEIKALPESIGKLKSLQHLYLWGNQLTELPKSFENLNNLEQLFLGDNQLESIPENFCNLNKLRELDLGNNQMIKLPNSFGNLHSLETVDLGSNNLKELPASLGELKNLQKLDLSNNAFSTLPLCILRLKKLHTLILTGIPLQKAECEDIVNTLKGQGCEVIMFPPWTD